jgi:hypothetical protein
MKTKEVTRSEDQENRMEEIQIAHLAGVFDASGVITIRLAKNSSYKINYTANPAIQIIRPDEDDPLLGKLMAYCEDERVKHNIAEIEHGKKRDNLSVKLETTYNDSIRRFLKPLVPYLVTNYIDAEIMLQEALPVFENCDVKTKSGFLRMMETADKLRTNKRGQIKYTTDYFEEKWPEIEPASI